MKTFYINLYHQGWYHRSHKPGCMNAHPGDMYPTMQAAVNDIDPEAPYIATVSVHVPDQVAEALHTYPEGSVPIPLSASRKAWQERGLPDAHLPAGVVVPFPQSVSIRRQMAEGSIETSENEAIEPPVTSRSYKPVHGGYPG